MVPQPWRYDVSHVFGESVEASVNSQCSGVEQQPPWELELRSDFPELLPTPEMAKSGGSCLVIGEGKCIHA